jgi:lauroyl/myristoyl acyltransferase
MHVADCAPVKTVPDAPRKSPPLFRREERREFRYQLSILMAETLSWVCWLMPGCVRGWFGDRCGDLFFRVSTTYRENVQDNLRHLPETVIKPEETVVATRHVFRTSARNFLDLITMPRHRRKVLLRSAESLAPTRHLLDAALAKGNGVVIITAHLGCFDFLGQALATLGYKLTVVTGRTTSRFVFDGVTHLRSSNGMTMVEPTPSGVRRVIQALRRGECVVFLTDRDFFENGLPVMFFGHETTLPPGAVRIARESRAPIVPVFTRRLKHGHEMTIWPAIEVPRSSDAPADLQAGLECVVDVLQRAISATPNQWAMFQRVWREAPPQPVRVFPVGSPLESELLERVAAALPERRASDGSPQGHWPQQKPKDRTDLRLQSEA